VGEFSFPRRTHPKQDPARFAEQAVKPQELVGETAAKAEIGLNLGSDNDGLVQVHSPHGAVRTTAAQYSESGSLFECGRATQTQHERYIWQHRQST